MPAGVRERRMTYQPKPIDTSAVQLPPELRELTEQLAENAHELWAAQRIAEGWSYGHERDDRARHHPNLVPYTDLSESEKEYDRLTAVGTLKAILTLGYLIMPPRPR
jgi:hypothetical protein